MLLNCSDISLRKIEKKILNRKKGEIKPRCNTKPLNTV